ncbi:MAG: 7-cyano-7-deazaguanine synthase [Phycisphaeraceae bacterium]|nr:7-cyano-7-deazaguanine synthase [Phycisphaeraceae bacterium]
MAKRSGKSWVVLLNDGGLRSLVATAMQADSEQMVLVFVDDGRLNSSACRASFLKQANRYSDNHSERYNALKQMELLAPHLRQSTPPTNTPGPKPTRAPLADLQLIAAAASVALQHHAQRLIWPIQCGDDIQAMAHATETILTVQQLVRFVHDVDLSIETPLMELSDRQMLEVGHQLGVPWEMAQTCLDGAPDPCHKCTGCLWRKDIFKRAALQDPLGDVG